MCCAITPRGLHLLDASREQQEATAGDVDSGALGGAAQSPELRAARRDVHVAGWVLAFERVAGRACTLHGADRAVMSPPLRSGPDARSVLRPADLRLPGGRAPHDFLRSDAAGIRREVEQFETVRPRAIIELRAVEEIDLIIELDDRVPAGRAAAKLERYDHFLAGWSVHTRRYGGKSDVSPVVVFVCRSGVRARECAIAADSVLSACRAYAGEYPFDWEYPGRAQILFAAERDAHEGSLHAYGLPGLPPEVRVAASHGDPRAGEAVAEPRQILRAHDASSLVGRATDG